MQQLRGLALSPTVESVDYSDKITLGLEPSSGAIVVNGEPGHLQFYDPQRDIVR
jgi:hypothetical protein